MQSKIIIFFVFLFLIPISFADYSTVHCKDTSHDIKWYGNSKWSLSGRSMLPAINTSEDWVYSCRPTKNELRLNDIILFKDYTTSKSNMFIMHRIIGTRKDCFITKGDNNDVADIMCINFGEIKGKVYLVK